MTITLDRVRRMLGQHMESDVPSDVLYEIIGMATDQVNMLASEDAPTDTKERAVIAIAAHRAYLKYGLSKDTASGGRFVPEGQAMNLRALEEDAGRMIQLISQSATKGRKIGPLAAGTHSLVDSTTDARFAARESNDDDMSW